MTTFMKNLLLKLICLFSLYFSSQTMLFCAESLHAASEAPYYEPKLIDPLRFLQEVEERDKTEFLCGLEKRLKGRSLKRALKALNLSSTLESLERSLEDTPEWIQRKTPFKQTLIRKVLGLFIKSEQVAAKRLKRAKTLDSLDDIYSSLPESSKTAYIKDLYDTRFIYFLFSVFDEDEDEDEESFEGFPEKEKKKKPKTLKKTPKGKKAFKKSAQKKTDKVIRKNI